MAEGLQKYKDQWAEMDPKFKYALIAIVIGGAILTYVQGQKHDRLVKENEEKAAQKLAQRAAEKPAPGGVASNDMRMSALPSNNRNQGLEDLLVELQKTSADARASREEAKAAGQLVQKMNDRVALLESQKSQGGAVVPNDQHSAFSNALPPPVDFSQPGARAAGGPAGTSTGGVAGAPNGAPLDFGLPAGATQSARPPSKSRMKVFDEKAEPEVKKSVEEEPLVSIPANSALESVMLTGINARSNASGGAASGSVVSANNVGAPFVTRIKGNAILPNGWKVSYFADCQLSGTGIAVLSSERANVIANLLTCIDKKGVIYEAKIKAYGVDLDGIQGISGRVVTKQGSILAKAALAGVISGLGSSLSPTALPGYNSNQQSGQQQGIQYPNGSLVAQRALGGGLDNASKEIAKFYMDYAKEMFPVIEVNAGTRITWILQETVELSAK